jgi:glutaminyl-peptide cyclotransferase
MKKILYIFVIASLFHSCKDEQTQATIEPISVPNIPYSIVAKLPHDTNSFTEGLFFSDSTLFESTGAPEELPKAKSEFGIVNTKNGVINSKAKLDRNIYFGEGIIKLNNKIYQLTYKNKACFVYDATTFKKINTYYYANEEGWGLTTDGTNIIMSDGTNEITYLTDSFTIIKKLAITENGYARNYINELEYINGYIYANIWTTNYVTKIDPKDGTIVGKIDVSSLQQEAKAKYAGANETNGIAYQKSTDKILITGKNWPYYYEVKFAH